MECKFELFMEKLNKANDIEHFYKYILFLLAPVVSGLKPASTITLKKNKKEYLIWIKHKENFLNKIDLKYIVLRENEDAIILLIYSKNKLKEIIEKVEVVEFLTNLGYKIKGNIDITLNSLVCRYKKFHCPHELGIFLGIPLDDVKDFIECSDKKCLLCGYWKVFNNFDSAIEIFDSYNKAREIVLNCGVLEMNSNKIIFLLKNNFSISV